MVAVFRNKISFRAINVFTYTYSIVGMFRLCTTNIISPMTGDNVIFILALSTIFH